MLNNLFFIGKINMRKNSLSAVVCILDIFGFVYDDCFSL